MTHDQYQSAGDHEPENVHGRVLAAARATPYDIAIFEGAAAMSYGRLRRRAAAIARRLIDDGITPGAIVTVRMRRSADQVVALLGVLMAGCAFVVIDPDDAVERQAFMIADSGAVCTLARPDALADGDLCIDDDEQIEDLPLPVVRSDDLAYIVYTSGTTGVPNGVEITHGNLLGFINWTITAFGVRRQDHAGYAMGLTFDAAQSEIWPYLARGASIDVIDDNARSSADLLRAWLIDRRITIGTVPMALAEQLLSAAWPREIALRLMLTGGDVLKAFPRAVHPFDFVNNYGPSECTIVATSGLVPVRDPLDQAPDLPTIGRPIAGAEIHLLDDSMQPVADGAEGDLWIGGSCVGRGYRSRPELTAARFVPDPFSSQRGARLYRTGDRARRLATGEYAFCGRHDTQVKIRGVRIELDEVAVGLQRHERVGSAVVTVHEDPLAGRQLIAYLAPVPGIDVPAGRSPLDSLPDASAMRAFMERFLPRSHVPAYFVAMLQLPMTRNGKIDHDRLPPPGREASTGRVPQTETECIVAEIVAEVLGIAGVSASDDFFLIGGHSLLATQVVIQCRETFDVDLSLRDIFDAPTIEGLAALIDARDTAMPFHAEAVAEPEISDHAR
ncbi:non-ribosomal peptide synthetase [Sphingomonas sp. M6A6_1c]